MPKSYNYNPYSSPSDAVKAELSEIDASIRAAAIFFVISAIGWLMLGTVFALLAAVKSHSPDFAGAAGAERVENCVRADLLSLRLSLI